jgi:UDPglucose 6-dehydrogenase
MIVGIIGVGVVGKAVKYGFEKLGHRIIIHDVALGTDISDVIWADIVFVCVPTPALEDDACDTSIVESVVMKLDELKYKGIVAIKSTVAPGTTEKLQQLTSLNICFVPEFLRERCAITDFIENHDVCIIGTIHTNTFNLIKKVHGKYPKKFVQLTPTEAELCKYFNNIYNAALIVFANSFYEVCKVFGVDYMKIKDAMVNRNHIVDIYLDCNDNCRGFGGMCLPKDTKAIAHLCEKLGVNVDFFKMLLDENDKYKITVYEGMRK